MTGSGGPRPARTRWRRTLLAVAALVTGGVALQLVVAAPALPATRPAGQLAQGRELYMRSCAWCHGQRGEGSGYGPSLVGVGAASVDFQLTTGRMPLDSEDRTPQREPPAFTPDQIDALVVYVTSLGGNGPPIPDVDLAGADLTRGHNLYQQHCAACHSATGTGGALTDGRTAPELDQATPVQVAESIRVGPGAMPVFGRDVLNDAEVNDVAAYVRHLQRGGNPGGFSLGRIGPVPEGLVAWVVGLGLLVVLVRVIGERAPHWRRRAGGGHRTGGAGE